MSRALLLAGAVAVSFGILAFAASGSSGAAASAPVKTCKAGYRHAVIAGSHKCLKAGQLCARRLDRVYHRYKFHCHSGRLAPLRPPPPSADVAVTKTVSAPSVTAGGTLTYTITVTNNGPNTAAGVVVSDVLPSSVTLQSISVNTSAGTGCSGATTVTCSLGAIASGRSHAFSLLVRTNAAGAVSNTATVSSSSRDPSSGNNSSMVSTTVVPVPQHTLTVAKAGSGSGTVTSVPAGVACGALCTASFAQGTVVTLTAAPAAGSTFTGWGGACTGTGTCTVTMDAAKSVTATFALAPPATFTLIVSKGGTGSGTVTSTPAGINCGTTCSAAFSAGTVVTLTGAPAAGSTFTGWGGACTGTGTCTVTMDAAKSVTATFALAPPAIFTLIVSKGGTGSGTVTSAPAGLNCGTTCSATFSAGTVVTLTATPAAGSTFTGWGGACTGTGTCTVTMDAARSVTATFAGTNCHASYPTVCIPPPPPSLNCSDVPYRNFPVLHNVPNPDPHRFDGDRDGIGCET